jgi:hypothetical protein
MAQGVIDIEGDPDLVREIYRDMKEHLLRAESPRPTERRDATGTAAAAAPDKSGETKPKGKRRTATRKNSEIKDAEPSVLADSPKLDKNLDTAGLPAYYRQFEPKNHPEKILVFLKFMTDELKIESPNTDQFYTCYERVNERIPKIFSQAFRDASGRKFGFIDYNSPSDIRLTTTGNNHFKFDLKRKSAD